MEFEWGWEINKKEGLYIDVKLYLLGVGVEEGDWHRGGLRDGEIIGRVGSPSGI